MPAFLVGGIQLDAVTRTRRPRYRTVRVPRLVSISTTQACGRASELGSTASVSRVLAVSDAGTRDWDCPPKDANGMELPHQ
jgi:hypothetical protein